MIYIIVLIIALIQATLINIAAIGSIKPDLLLVFVVFVALRKGWLHGAGIGVWAGFLADCLSIGPFVNTFIYAICGALAGLFKEKFYFFRDRHAA